MLVYVFSMFGLFLLIERLMPNMPFAKVPHWFSRALFMNVLSIGMQLLAGLTWERWIQGPSLIHLADHMWLPAAALLAYIIKSFFDYWWHRLRHTNNTLWRYVHQLHHSPARLETLTAFYVHPLDFVAQSIMGAIILYPILGLNADAVGIYVLIHAFVGFLEHSNIRGVPRWVGYFIQTPVMHRVHHEYGEHRYNYGDVVWWDMIFGTYRNDREEVARCGFDVDKEMRLVPMLMARDVHAQHVEPDVEAAQTEAEPAKVNAA